jgi:translation elongation factor EF-G
MKVRVDTPDEFIGDVMADFHTRRAEVGEMQPGAGSSVAVVAYVPMVELYGYAKDLDSMTHGRASFEMAFSHYQDRGTDDGGDVAGVPSPLKPIPPSLSASAAAEPPLDDVC